MKKLVSHWSRFKYKKLAYTLAPVFAVFFTAMLALGISMLHEGKAASVAQLTEPSPSPTASAEPTATPAPTRTPQGDVVTVLSLRPSVEELEITVCAADGTAIPGVHFALRVVNDASGVEKQITTDVNGKATLEGLDAGNYSVFMSALKGYAAADTARCEVLERLAYQPIAHIEEVVEVHEVAELPEEEVKPAVEAAPDNVVERIDSGVIEQTAIEQNPEAVIVSGDTVIAEQPTEEVPVSYTYDYQTGESGYLLYADGATQSDVLPVEEGSILSYGMRRFVSYYAADGSPLAEESITEEMQEGTDYFAEESAEKVELIYAPGEVDTHYAITPVAHSEPLPSAAPTLRVGWYEENGKSYYYGASGRPVTGLKNIDGKLYFFDGTGARAKAIGLDVSYFNSNIDWNAVKAQGIDFVIVRVAGRTWGSGKLFEDENSYRQGSNGGYYLQGAKAAGLRVGAYVYSNAINTNEAVEEASLAVEIVRRSGVSLDMPIYMDLEYTPEYPDGRADLLGADKRAEIARAFCTTVQNSGYGAGVYAGQNYFASTLNVGDVAQYSVWFASYTENYRVPSFRPFNIWQFTSEGRVNGVPEPCDMNVIF